MNLKSTCSGSLESYNPSKVSKNPHAFNTKLAIFALGQLHCLTPISVPKLGFVKIFSHLYSLAHTLPMYLHSIGRQQNHIHNIVLFELGREPQKNILLHIYIYIYIYIYIHLYDDMLYQTIKHMSSPTI
jgi:hypothetical protein